MSKVFKKKAEAPPTRKVILRVRNDSKDRGVISNNFPNWMRYWIEIKISEYGEKYVTALKDMELIKKLSSAELAVKYPIKALEVINLDLFNTTDDQDAQLNAITEQVSVRQNDRLIIEWKRTCVDTLTAEDATIQAENDAVKSYNLSKTHDRILAPS